MLCHVVRNVVSSRSIWCGVVVWCWCGAVSLHVIDSTHGVIDASIGVILCRVMSCRVMSCRVVSCIVSCRVVCRMSCDVVPYRIVSCDQWLSNMCVMMSTWQHATLSCRVHACMPAHGCRHEMSFIFMSTADSAHPKNCTHLYSIHIHPTNSHLISLQFDSHS